MKHNLELIPFGPAHQPHFERLNRAWLEEFYYVEPVDKYVLENPEKAILDPGGKILMATVDGNIAGTIALKPVAPGTLELTKMAVDKAYRGVGAGKLLCKAAIEEARKLGAGKIILYSETRLNTAISIYRKFGFMEADLEPGAYERANIKMELDLTPVTADRRSGLIESYGQAHKKITASLREFPREMWQWQPPFGKWTIHQNLLHLADSEANSYVRCRMFAAQPGGTVMAYDQDLWASRLGYHEQSADDALALFGMLRRMSHDLIRRLPEKAWENTIEHPENGTMKFIDWLRTYENHTHIGQMRRVFREWAKAGRPVG